MKKLLTLLLAFGFAFGMVACGGESSSTEEATEEAIPAEEEVEVVEEVVAPVEEVQVDSTSTEEDEHEHPEESTEE